MTSFAGNFKVFAGQFEDELVMGEMFAKPVNTIVTIEAGCSIRGNVIHHKHGITQTVTCRADVQVKDCYIRGVTIRAFERFLLSLELVRVQHVSR